MHNSLSTYLQRDKRFTKQSSCRSALRSYIVSTGSFPFCLPAIPHGDVPIYPVCSGAIWERTRRGRTAAVRRRDAGSVLVTLVHAGSDADDVVGLCTHFAVPERRLIACRQVVNLPRFEAPLARLQSERATRGVTRPRSTPGSHSLHIEMSAAVKTTSRRIQTSNHSRRQNTSDDKQAADVCY